MILFEAYRKTDFRRGSDQRGSTIRVLDELFPLEMEQLRMEIELVKGASNEWNLDEFLAGELTPVFFGSAINNFGVREILDALINWAPAPKPRDATVRMVEPTEGKFSGFVFKIQAIKTIKDELTKQKTEEGQVLSDLTGQRDAL